MGYNRDSNSSSSNKRYFRRIESRLTNNCWKRKNRKRVRKKEMKMVVGITVGLMRLIEMGSVELTITRRFTGLRRESSMEYQVEATTLVI